MLSTTELLDLYKAEKADLDDIGEPFPDFKSWKQEFEVEYRRNHVTVSVKEALDEADKIVEAAEVELDINEETAMNTNETVTVEAVAEAPVATVDPAQAKRDARNARRRELRAQKKAAAAKPVEPAAAKPERTRKPAAKTKTDLARTIFKQMYGRKERKDIIDAMIARAKLTANGASTYYQKYKKEVA